MNEAVKTPSTKSAAMTVEELERGFRDLMVRIYDKSFVSNRRRRFFRDLRALRGSREIAAETAAPCVSA